MDRHRSPFPAHPEPSGSESPSTPPLRSGTPPTNRSTSHVDVTALVRSLQRSAGTADCFRMGHGDCDDVDCDWRSYCLPPATDAPPDDEPSDP